ncbi:hypothetical protein SAE02_26240 [Skermanella aerolata]|jgi:hypothetical protein|uniref:Uncharacterized protein n=2 Tax=Skermanella aerolata TaxID=393310 RepID=A0A512DPT8_9PROT|nr:hypothetical protein N826_21765 [Skermanella aerolata KACC 11604]GEO38476.1 hypothetical protein SAE02_26240 [Skermanella aerolata]
MYQFGMPHHPVLTSAVLAILLLAAAPSGLRIPGIFPAQAAESAFVEGIDDLPLMPGLVGVGDQSVVFDKPGGRIVQAVATGRVRAAAVRSFYADTAPQLGWKSAGEGRYTRDGESLRIELTDPGAPGDVLTVRFIVNPQ